MRGRGIEKLILGCLLLHLQIAVSPSAPQLNGAERVCGKCSELEKQVQGMDLGWEIEDQADKVQQRGDWAGAARVMCGGLCSRGKGNKKAASPLLMNPGTWSNLGVLFRELEMLEVAKACYRIAARLEPRNAGHRYRIGNAMMAQNDFEKARQAYMKATALHPRFGDAYNNMGNCLTSMSLFPEATQSYRYALNANPRNANYYCNLGGMVARTNVTEAIGLLEQGLKINPRFPEVYNNLANFRRDLGHLVEAEKDYRMAEDMMPASGEIIVNLASVRAYLCMWSTRKETLKKLKALTEQELSQGLPVSLSPFYANIFAIDPVLLRRIAQHYSAKAAAQVQYIKTQLRAVWKGPSPISQRRPQVKIGIISSDLTNHIVGHGVKALLHVLDLHRFQVFCYALTADDGSDARAQISAKSTLRDVGDLPDHEIAMTINADQVHVLVDLNGHTKGNRIQILALKPSEIQVSMHGYAGTSGSDFVDYFVSDRVVVPPEHAAHFSEKLVYMPLGTSFFMSEDYGKRIPITEGSSFKNRDLRSIPGLAGKFRFVCFNNLYKVTPEAFDAWAKILKGVPNSILWLLTMPGQAEAYLKKAASKRGLDPNRIIFSALFPREEHLEWKSHGNVFLDSIVYNAHSSAADSLAAGVPVVTVAGPSMPARVAASLLLTSGLQVGVARTTSDYIRMAIASSKSDGKEATRWRKQLNKNLEKQGTLNIGRWAKRFELLIEMALKLGPHGKRFHLVHV